MRSWAMTMTLVATLVGCNGGKDSGTCEGTGEVTVYLNDSSTGNPILGSIAWVDTNSDSGSMACPGECQFSAPPGSVTITATPDDPTVGEPQNQSTVVSTALDCSSPPFNGVEFDF